MLIISSTSQFIHCSLRQPSAFYANCVDFIFENKWLSNWPKEFRSKSFGV